MDVAVIAHQSHSSISAHFHNVLCVTNATTKLLWCGCDGVDEPVEVCGHGAGAANPERGLTRLSHRDGGCSAMLETNDDGSA